MFKNKSIQALSTTKAYYWYSFLLCIGLLGFAIFLQTVVMLAPCPLCELQRLMFLIIAFLSLLGGLVNPGRKGVLWFSFFIALFAILGALLAGHQLWLERHPPPNPDACGMGLSYLFSVLPVSQALKVAIMGTGDCATVTWRLLGLSIPVWSFGAFILLLLISIYQVCRSSRP
ncbi:MAG: disulfide bond formation protein B [Gammaproteobacteria bacterium]